MSRTKLRKARPKALFGEAAATLTAAGIQAAATAAAAAVQAKASRDAAKTQATNIKSAAEKQAEAIKAQSDSDKENTEKSLDLMREQHDEELAMQKDIQMDIQRAMGQQNENARLEQSKIQVRNGGLAKGKGNRRLAMPHSFLQGGNMPFIVTDGGNAIPLGTTPEGYNLYEVRGNDHEHYHKAQGGKNKTGVGFHFADGSVVEGEGNQNTSQGEYLLTTPTNAAFISKHSINGFNPVKAVNAGMNPMQAFLLQEQIKRANGISDDGKGNSNPPVKKNGGMIYTRGTSNILQPYYTSDLGRRTLKCGGRTKAGLGDYIRSGLDWLLRDNKLAQYVNNSSYGKFVDNAWNSYNNWANGLVNDISDAISTAHISPSIGWYGLGSTPTKAERVAASKSMKNYYSDLIKEIKKDIKSGQLIRDLRNTNQLFSDIYGATGINLGGEYGLLGSATPDESTAIAGAILRGGRPLTRRAMAEAIGSREAQAEMANALNTYGVRSGATTKFGIPATEVDPLAEQLVTDRAFANQYATTTNNVMANAMRKAQQKAVTSAAQERAATDRAFDKYLKDNPQAAFDIWKANEKARIFTPTISINGHSLSPNTVQFTDDLGLNAFGVPYAINDYGTRMMQIDNALKSQIAAMPTTKKLIGYMRNGAAQRSLMPRSLTTAGQRVGNVLDNAYWWGRYLPARTAEKLKNMKDARAAQASLNDPVLDNWANGIMSSWRPASQKATTQAVQNAVKANWIKRHPYLATGAGIAGLGIGGSLLYNAFAPNNSGMPSGPVTSAAVNSAVARQQAQARQSAPQRSIINNINNDSTSTARNTATNVVNNNATNIVTNSPVSTSNDTTSVNRKVARQTSNASKQVSTSQATADAKANNETITFKNFNEAFDYYHKKYGNNGTFTFGGLKYTTKKETDKEAEARNRRWGARRTEESLADILGDISNKSDNDIWNIYLNRQNRRQTKFGGSLRPQLKNGGNTAKSNNVNLNGIYDLAGAGINALGNLGGAFLATRGNNAAARYLSGAYNQAGNILANAYNSMTGIDSDYLKQADFKSAHMMPALQAVTSNAAAPLAQEERSRLRTLRNAGRYSASGAAAINRMNTAETDSRDARARIYAVDNESQDKIRERNAQALNDAAKFNAQADIEANKNYLGYKTDILKYNNDIANTRRLGAAQSIADALTQSSNAMATARQSNGNAWMSALSSSGNSFANAISTIGKRVADYNNIMAGTDIGAQVGAVVSNNDGNKAASIYQTLDFNKPIDRDYGMQLERQFPFLKGTNSTGTALEWKDKPSKQDTPTSVNTQLTPQNSLVTTPASSSVPLTYYNGRRLNLFF